MRLRIMGGWFGVVIFLALLAWFYMAGLPKWSRLFLFLPAMMAAVGFLQYYNHFCVNFGMRGKWNVEKEAFHTEVVADPGARRLDREKALRMLLLGFILSLAVTILVYLL